DHMDVIRAAAIVLLSLTLVHCAKEKKLGGFVEVTSACEIQSHPHQFVVHWKSGEFSVVEAKDKTDFLENFLPAHKDEVEWAEHDFLLSSPSALALEQSSIPYPEWATDRIEAPKVWAE